MGGINGVLQQPFQRHTLGGDLGTIDFSIQRCSALQLGSHSFYTNQLYCQAQNTFPTEMIVTGLELMILKFTLALRVEQPSMIACSMMTKLVTKKFFFIK